MQNIRVGRYPNPGTNAGQIPYQGWIEPSDRTWIAFIDLAGRPTFFLHREPSGGVIVPLASGD